MRHLSLFTGIGGFDLAAEWMGWENVAQVEIDQFCLEVLKKNFPNTKRYTDVKTFPAANYTGRVDILTGGFPCQPFSQAGKRQGADDDRHLWPAMLEVIRIIKPTWVIAENVRGLITIEDGLVFEQVCIDLESIGYEVQPLIIPACAVNAPHRRDRIWFIAHAINSGHRRTEQRRGGAQDKIPQKHRPQGSPPWEFERADREWATLQSATNPEHQRPIQYKQKERPRSKERLFEGNPSSDKNWLEIAAELCSVDDGLPVELGEFKLSKAGHKNEQIKAYGNAIVPFIAYQIFSAIDLQ